MKLKQRIVLAYFTQKFKMLEKISIQSAAREAFTLLCTPHLAKKTYLLTPVFQQAKKASFIFEQHTMHGFIWPPQISNGHRILICHGFDSSLLKFENFIEPLVAAGFEVIAFDAPAHGFSGGKTINVLQYRNFILEIINKFGPVNGILGHSFGGIAAALAAETLKDRSLKRLVLVAPATETIRSINDFCRILHLSLTLKTALEQLICDIGGQPLSWYSASRAIQQIQLPVLWVHDRTDKITPYKDVEPLVALQPPHIHFHITEGLGHSPYNNEKVREKIIAFMLKITEES